ncbi:hypothetical protein DR950_00620 [Kitasatospora xanthocidica]|uniref:Uncharacterized protein n=1 Tax=Kitasatospora xanthocidica TaxID=83382 RepID=A0A372ZM24_9ACTN|nr:hypothetical protein DR950_00620 [Kitasatospora xanthocidica]
MLTNSTTSYVYSPHPRRKHAAPDRDRLGTFPASSWIALNLLGAGVLGLLIHHTETTRISSSPAATTPDQPTRSKAPLRPENRSVS